MWKKILVFGLVFTILFVFALGSLFRYGDDLSKCVIDHRIAGRANMFTPDINNLVPGLKQGLSDSIGPASAEAYCLCTYNTDWIGNWMTSILPLSMKQLILYIRYKMYLKQMYKKYENYLDNIWHKDDGIFKNNDYVEMLSGISVSVNSGGKPGKVAALLEELLTDTLTTIDKASPEGKTFTILGDSRNKLNSFLNPAFVLFGNPVGENPRFGWETTWSGVSEKIADELAKGSSSTLKTIIRNAPEPPTSSWIRGKDRNGGSGAADMKEVMRQVERYVGAQFGDPVDIRSVLSADSDPITKGILFQNAIKINNRKKLMTDTVFEAVADIRYVTLAEKQIEKLRFSSGTTYTEAIKDLRKIAQIQTTLLTKILKELSNQTLLQAEIISRYADEDLQKIENIHRKPHMDKPVSSIFLNHVKK